MKKSDNDKLNIPFDVMEFIAASVTDDIRIMEGALVKLLALSSLKQQDVTIALAKEVIKNLIGLSALQQTSLNQIARVVAEHYEVSEKKLYSKSRIMEVAFARHVAMFLSRELTQNSLILIGKHFGNRDHSTVIHACKTVEKKILEDKALKKNISILKTQLQ